MSLRARLLLVLAVLATVGLLVAGVVTYTELRSFLVERVDRTLAASEVTAQETLIATTNDEGARLSAAAKADVAAATARLEAAGRDRSTLASSLPGDLLALYEKLAVRGTGAALLRQRTCEGCRMVLAGTDLHALRQAADDDVVTCPECGCILVRTDESGL